MTKLPLSVIILTRNEEKHISRALTSVPFASEVLVVDSGSKDGTLNIARKFGARVVEKEWCGFREQGILP